MKRKHLEQGSNVIRFKFRDIKGIFFTCNFSFANLTIMIIMIMIIGMISPWLKKLYARARLSTVAVIVTSQYLCSLPPICRTNADWCIVGDMKNRSIKLLADEHLFRNFDKPQFGKFYSRSTKDCKLLIISNNLIEIVMISIK